MKFKKFFMFLVAAIATLAVVSCTTTKPNPDEGNKPEEKKVYTYNDFTAVSPSNWNPLTYQDNNDVQIMSRISSSFFEFDYKFDSNGEIVPGEFEVIYSAATKLEDVTAQYAGEEAGWGIPTGAKNRAYAITLREDLKWDDGTAIKAEDFVYSMQQLLDPAFKNYRADSYYVGSTVIHKAKDYNYIGSADWFAADTPYAVYSEELDSELYFTLGPTVQIGEETVTAQPSFRAAFGFPDSYTAELVAKHLAANYIRPADKDAWVATAVEMQGKTFAEIKANETYKAVWNDIITFWQTEPNEELDFFVAYYTFPEISFDEVGIFVGENEYQIVLILDLPLDLVDEEGNLTYKAAYNMSDLPLVKRSKYEANKVEPQYGSSLWTSTYNSDVASTASWGPYRLTSFQVDKQYILERNENWYGYNMPENEGLYQTDRIVCNTIPEWSAAWLKFLAGEIEAIGIDVSVAPDYKNSDRAYFTPDDFVASLQLQSDKSALEARQSEGVNKLILANVKFRKALSLSIDRAAFTQKTTTSSLPGFGLFNSMHYYDVANGGVYRNSDVAKQVLCNIYGVNVEDYNGDLDKAVEAITGYNLELARQLVTEAYNECLAAGEISATDKVVLTLGTGAINETVQRRFDFLSASWATLVEGTPLEGRLECEVKDFSTAWADDFRAGKYDVCMGGWTGAAWDPGYFLLAYLSPDYMYSAAWDTSSVQMEFTMVGVKDEEGNDIHDTMSLMDWYDCLNGASGARYDFSSSAISNELRLQLIAALEEQVLQVYYSVPLYNNYGASLISYKVDYITYEYNTFMGYGGLKYMTYNYSDAEWAKVVSELGGQIDYK